MMYRCSTISAPLRAEAKHSSEMISELLYGEYLTATGSETELWLEVQCEWDDYIGWVSKGQIEEVSSFGLSQSIVSLKTDSLYYPGSLIEENILESQADIDSFIDTYIDTPYYWGGRSLRGIDCSGLSQIFYKLKMIRIPRDASLQALCGETVQNLESSKTGDLAFFANEKAKITHVGILLGNNKILHATETQGKVVIDTINDRGIINSQTTKLSHNLVKIIHIYFDLEHLS